MITIYHNPRCSKSRETLALVEAAATRLGEPVEIVEYLKTPPSLTTLRQLHTMLGVSVREMMRENEAPYAELGLEDPGLTDNELLAAVADNPILLQRPVVVRNRRAAIGRPPENVADVLAG
jgi:arsenate reductase